MAYVDEDGSSGSGDDVTMLDGHNKRQSVTPGGSGRGKRSRKATGDAIVDAMLEIAAASKMRAAAIMKNEDQFSISKCIKVLDEMQDTLASMEDFDLELDNMELVAAAAGYYYYNSITRQPRHSSSPYGSSFMSEVLDGPDDGCREMFRMDKHVFHNLCGILRQRGMLRDTAGVMIEEQLAIFLNIIGHNERNRVIQERFQHSGETISRHFNNVLKAIKSLSREFLQPPPIATPPEILSSNRFYPYFKDCIGVIDGMHVPAHLPAKDQSRFRNKKGVLSQNVLAACTFDLQFIFIYPGWEGSAADSRVLRAVLDDPDQNFPIIPEGKYYIVDTGYSNLEGFIAPYPGVRYHLHEFRGANQLPRNPQELFNHRHSSLRNTIQVSFDVLKTRFPILKVAPQYGFHVQRDIVIAACVLHNYIRREGKDDWLFANVDGVAVAELPDIDDESDIQLASSIQDHMAFSLRESITGAMWKEMLEIGPCDNPYQMGFLTGQRFSKKIRSRLSSDLVLQNQLLPFAKTPESQALIKALTINNQKKFPKYWDELLGTAEGSGVPVLYMILINFRKEILPFLPKSAVANSNADTSLYNTPDDCSDVLVVSDTMAIAAHNEDANVALVGHTYIIKATLPNGLSFVGYTYAGELPSCAFGFNSNGLAFTLNSVPPSEAEIVAGGIGRNFISRDLLEATSIDDALSKIQSSEVSVGHSYNLIDIGTRRILNVETASRNRVSVHEVGATPFFHANMYLHLQVEQVDDDNSKGRQERAAVLPKRSKDDFLSLLGDTDHKRYPIYMTGPTLYTLCTAMIDLDDKTLSIIEGNPKNGKVAYIFSMSSKELSHRKINQYY